MDNLRFLSNLRYVLKSFFQVQNQSVPHWIYIFIRSALAVLFIYSGIGKLLNPFSFSVIIEAYGLAPSELAFLLAMVISIMEILAGLALLFDIYGSLGVIFSLLGIFVLVLGYGLWIGLDVDCGCFGPEDPEAKAFHGLQSALYRDVLMVFGILYLYWWRFTNSIQPLQFKKVVSKIKYKRTICDEI